MRKLIILSLLVVLVFVAFSFFEYFRFHDNKLHIVFCNVGQGDAIFIRTPSGKDILIDGGPDQSVLSCLSRHMPFWDRQIELMMLTHPHQDHYMGLIHVLKRYTTLSFASQRYGSLEKPYQELASMLASKQARLQSVCQSDAFRLSDGLSIEMLWPKECGKLHEIPQEKTLDPNTVSLVQLLRFGKFKLLLTGDAEGDIQNQIRSLESDVDVLKVPHHGSIGAVDDEFLDLIKPELSIIMVGKNSYGHPSKKVIEQLRNSGSRVLRSDLDGEVEVITDGTSWKVNK